MAYFSKSNSIDLSIILYENHQAVGLMPLMAHKNKNNQWILSGNGTDILEPIFKSSLSYKVKKKFEIQILNLIFDLAKELKINKCQFVNMELFRLSEWYVRLLDLTEETFTTHHYLVNLSLSIEEIRLRLRKSFKSLVNQGFREWKIQVHEKTTKELFENFRLLHKSVAKKTTRPIETWNIQKQQIDSGESILVTVSDKKNFLVGAGLFAYTSFLAKYAVGVYKRELFDKPLGHAVQIKAIEIFKKKGLNWYEIGQYHLKIDKYPPTEKELSISYFEKGFATDVVARQHLVISIKH